MDQLWLKALHVAAVLVFTGGLLTQSLALAFTRRDVAASGLLSRLQRWDQRVTLPAMLAVWTLGIAAALGGGWFGAGWLSAKLLLVVALTGLHGLQAGALRRLALGGAGPRHGADWVPTALVLSYAVIAVLAVAKPF